MEHGSRQELRVCSTGRVSISALPTQEMQASRSSSQTASSWALKLDVDRLLPVTPPSPKSWNTGIRMDHGYLFGIYL